MPWRSPRRRAGMGLSGLSCLCVLPSVSAVSRRTGLLTASARGALAEITLPSLEAPSGLHLLDCELLPLTALWTTARLL